MEVPVNLRHLEKGSVHLEGEVDAKKLEVEGVDELIQAEQPLKYDLDVERVGRTILVEGALEMVLTCECARCLKPFRYVLRLDPWRAELPLEGEERVPVVNDCVDLTPFIREDTLLAFPQHPLCETECSGLPKRAESAKREEGGPAESGSPAWEELNKLKLK